LSVLAAGRRSLSLSRSPSPSPQSAYSIFGAVSEGDTVQRTLDLFDVSMSHYFPGSVEPDDTSVRERPAKEGSDASLDEILCPLVALLTRLCQTDSNTKTRTRDWLVPPDMDRTNALEGQPTILGKGLRLMSCVYHPRLKDAFGELLYVCCDRDRECLPQI
jgi:hypothetical protein